MGRRSADRDQHEWKFAKRDRGGHGGEAKRLHGSRNEPVPQGKKLASLCDACFMAPSGKDRTYSGSPHRRRPRLVELLDAAFVDEDQK